MNLQDMDGWAGVFIATCLAVAGACGSMLAGLGSFFSLKHRVATLERDMGDHNDRLVAIDTKLDAKIQDVRSDIQRHADRAEVRHNELLQALISRAESK